MTTLEFIEKNLHKAKINLKKAQERPNVKQIDLDRLEEKAKHYQEVLSALKEIEITMAYIVDNGLTFDLLSYSERKGFWE